MARGIEELAEMQVTGPVQGGDMVMKPNEAPVGAAALLNKMSRQNTPGIFKLPMPDKQMPDFMKVAAEGVEQQTAQGDSINKMAGELMRQGINIQGMGMDEIIQIYEQTFGSPGDVDEFGVSKIDPSDWRTIIKILEAGGDPGTETQMTNLWQTWQKIKDRAGEDAANEWLATQEAQAASLNSIKNDAKKIETFAPEGEQLAYINKEEADILKLMGGSGEREPITGIESFRKTRKERKEANIAAETARRVAAGDTSDYVQRQMASTSGSGGRPGGAYETEQAAAAYAAAPDKDLHMAQAMQEAGFTPTSGGAYDQALQAAEQDKTTTDKDETKTVLDFLKDVSYRPYLDQIDALSAGMRKLKIGEVKDFIKSDKSAAGWANLLNQFEKRGGDDNFQEWLEGEEGAWKDTMLQELKDDPGMEDITDTSYKEVLEFMKTKHGGSEEFKKRFGDTKAEWWSKNIPQTSGGAEDMVQNLSMSDIQNAKGMSAKEKRRLMYDLQQARDTASEGKGQERRSSGGGPVEKITEEEEVVTTTDPRAGAFGVGGTMPYTHDVATGGTQMDVPLGRRFQIGKDKKYRGTTGGMDLNEAMQYATLGGYSQLEPFQEYLTRRREHLGEDEPIYFDEEGNVIYSGVT